MHLLMEEIRHFLFHSNRKTIDCAECEREHYEEHWIGQDEHPDCARCIRRKIEVKA